MSPPTKTIGLCRQCSAEIKAPVYGEAPCPFCEGRDVVIVKAGADCYWYECRTCECSGPVAETPEEATDRWAYWHHRERGKGRIVPAVVKSKRRKVVDE
jgi:hypothetical protein